MNNFFTLQHICKTLNHKLQDSTFDFAVSFLKNQLELFFDAPNETLRLVCSVQSQLSAVFLDEYRSPKASNSIRFFDSIQAHQVQSVRLVENDRILIIDLENNYTILFLLFGSRPNVFLLCDSIIVDSFKQPANWVGSTFNFPEATKQQWDVAGLSSQSAILRSCLPTVNRTHLKVILAQDKIRSLGTDQPLIDFAKKLNDQYTNNVHSFRVLEDGSISNLSEDILPLKTIRTFQSANEAVRWAYYFTKSERRLSARKNQLLTSLNKSIQNAKLQIDRLSNTKKSEERALKYEQFGHLLMANSYLNIEIDQQFLQVQNFYENNESINIPVDSKLSVAKNAEKYYAKSRFSKESQKEALQKKTYFEDFYTELDGAIKELEQILHPRDLDKWVKSNHELIQKSGLNKKGEQEDQLPFKVYQLNDKYQMWLGRNSQSNDQLTRMAHKEDIWLHARGVAGSHGLIRMNNNKANPPMDIIEKAAEYVAAASKARGSALVPVIYTKRKYIRKPKGAAAGAVLVDKEEVILVEPKKA